MGFIMGRTKRQGWFSNPSRCFGKCSDKELLWILIKKTVDELFYQKLVSTTKVRTTSSCDSRERSEVLGIFLNKSRSPTTGGVVIPSERS